MRTLAIFHSGAISGPLRTLVPRLRVLAEDGEVRMLFPWEGAGSQLARREFPVESGGFGPTTWPSTPAAALAAPIRLLRELRALRQAVRTTNPDVVLVATVYLPVALLAARLEGVPSVLYAAELLGSGARRGIGARLGAGAVRRPAQRATAVVACSEWVARQYLRARRLEVIPPGIAVGALEPAALPGTPPRIAVVGALSAGRGQDVALAALPLIQAEFPQASLLVAGEPHPRPVDEAFAAGLREGVGRGVQFVGSVSPVEPLLAAADVVVVPNRVEEGFGRVAFEAIAAGTPVVVTPLTAAARLLPEGCALVTAPGRPDLLAQAVLRLLRDSDLRSSHSASGRAWVASNLDETALAGRFADVVRAAGR